MRIAQIAARRNEKLWLIGGIVRDAALKRELSDVDIAVKGDTTLLAADVARALGGSFVPLHDDPVTARVVLRGFDFDFAALRAPAVLGDLLARDISVNSMAASLNPGGIGEILDPAGGLDDLRRGIVRAISRDNMLTDPLRALRLFRFMAQLDFRIDPESLEWAREAAGKMNAVAGERIFAELVKLLETPRAAKALRIARRGGVLRSIVDAQIEPAWEVIEVFDEWPAARRRLFDDWDELAAAINIGKLFFDPAVTKAAALLGSGKDGLQALKMTLERWKAPKRFCGAVQKIIELQQAVGAARESYSNSPDKMRVFAKYTQEAGNMWFAAVAYALAAAGGSDKGFAAFFHDLILAYRDVIGVVDAGPPLVNGTRLIRELGLSPGPLVGEVLLRIRQERICGTVASADEALAVARRLMKETPPDS